MRLKMATIRKRKDKWQAQIRRKGFSTLSKTFHKKCDALEWARLKENQADRRDFQYDISVLYQLTWKDLIIRYRDEVVSKKKCKSSETNHLNAYLKRERQAVNLCVADIKAYHFSQYRDKRLDDVKPATICRELGLFNHIYEVAKNEWGLPIDKNPLQLVTKPRIDNKRDRRLSGLEYLAILKATSTCRNQSIKSVIQLAVHTGMRRSEILRIRKFDINFENSTLRIPETKNGHERTIPLTSSAIKVMLSINCNDRLFNVTANAFRQAWDRVLVRAHVSGLKFHDLRHEAISRFFERGLSVPEVALISGHKTYTQLFRYTHLRAEDIARKL
jgi:integrase